MIEKMTFLSITGPKEDIDRVVDEYLSKYPMHLENALSELSDVRDIYPYVQNNPYKEWESIAESFLELIPGKKTGTARNMNAEEAVELIKAVREETVKAERGLPEKQQELAEAQELLSQLSPFKTLPAEIDRILQFKFIKYRFGRIPKDLYKKFEDYFYDDLNMIFVRTHTDDEYVWGICFIPEQYKEQTDALMSSLHFERIRIPDSYTGSAEEAYKELHKKCETLVKEIQEMHSARDAVLKQHADDIVTAAAVIERRSAQFDVRRLAACTKERESTYYILCGWMGEEDAKAFIEDTKHDSLVTCIEESADSITFETPPTRLKNPGLIKPFEMYIKMYGLPAYNETDPTAFVALTYSFLFGVMFGDLGQGLLLLIGGYFLYRKKHIALAGIISTAGFFSSIFGLMFGSVFGFEDVIPAIWLRPREAMTTLPLIGSLNTVLVVAIAFGMFLILTAMVMHILNTVKEGKKGERLFGTNGIAGFIFYLMIALSIILMMSGRTLPGGILMAALIGLPMLAFTFREPLERLVEKERPLIEEGVGMFIVQAFFEWFETMLSFFSNTLSFVRVGAFAVSHAAMMEVVLMLAGAENGGSPNWLVVVLGNLFVCGMEGMIVGIQVLRLEYYEMFSRFYKGSGREFTPFIKHE